MHRILFGLLAATSLASAANPPQSSKGNIVVANPWSRPTAPGMPMGVAYLTVTNNGSSDDTLIGAHTPAAARVEIHRTIIESGMARMRPAGELLVKSKGSLIAEPGGLHFMLVELKEPLLEGTSVPFVLQFRNAGEITVSLKVGPAGPASYH